MLPEIIFLAEPENPFCGDSNLLIPDAERFIVIQINRRIQPVRLQPDDFRQKLPGPVDGFILEVVTEGEVAQHFKKGTVTRGLSDVFDITGADTLLAGTNPPSGGDFLSGKIRLQRSHTGVD